MAEFLAPVDICNRALQICGLPRIITLNDQNGPAQECNAAYGRLRRAELARNLWTFATRRVSLRAMGLATGLLGFPAYAAGTTYAAGFVVSYGTKLYVSTRGTNLAHTPGTAPTDGVLWWESYFGPLTVEPHNLGNTTSTNSTYDAGELVYITPGDGTVSVYRSLLLNAQDPDAMEAWDADIVYASGAVVSYSSTNYQSLVNLNLGNTPSSSPTQWTSTVTNPTISTSWIKITSATVRANPIVYPLRSGPSSDPLTANAFKLPAGYLRSAPQDPRADAVPYMGLRRWALDDDVVEGGYIVTHLANAQTLASATAVVPSSKVLRFVADVEDVTTMPDMFCEGLAARIALAVGPTLCQDRWGYRQRDAKQTYAMAIRDARSVNAIEVGPVAPPESLYITCRL